MSLARLWRSIFPSTTTTTRSAMSAEKSTYLLAFCAACLLFWTWNHPADVLSGGGGPPYNAGSPPKYVYKIVPHSSVNPRYSFPVPIPASHTFVLSELDAKDGYIHLSTAPQIARTLNRFFSPTENPVVVLLSMDYKRLSGWKVVKWEEAGHGDVFPHLYANLEGENVDSFLELKQSVDGAATGDTMWDAALEEARGKGWLLD